MSAPEFLLPPDWVILGALYKDGVMVIASDKLNQATVEMARDYFETMYDPFGGIHEKTPTYKLSTEMRQFTIAYGGNLRRSALEVVRHLVARRSGRTTGRNTRTCEGSESLHSDYRRANARWR